MKVSNCWRKNGQICISLKKTWLVLDPEFSEDNEPLNFKDIWFWKKIYKNVLENEVQGDCK